MNVIAIIPARGGSKGLPLKNIRNFNGVPLVATAINAAKDAKLVSQVYVSTDSEAIADVATKYNAGVIVRPQDISGDKASSESAIIHAVEELTKQNNRPDIIVFLQCTAPFMTGADIDGTINKLLTEQADSSLAVVPFQHFLWSDNADGAQGINHDGLFRTRRQDLKPQYLEAGSVYAMRTEPFMQAQTRFCGKTALYPIDNPARSFEIDDAYEFYTAEHMAHWFTLSAQAKEDYRLRTVNFSQKLQKIKAVVFDFDGVFTDDSVYVDEHGCESVRCSRSDGMGISLLKEHTNLKLSVISSEKNSCVLMRCQKLGLAVVNNVSSKIKAISKFALANNLELNEICFCGNDVNDTSVLGHVGMIVSPANAIPALKDASDLVLTKAGGHGFVREFCDLLLEHQNYFKKHNTYKANEFDFRPWGYWETISTDECKCVKKIVVKPQSRLSLQSHEHRIETWVITSGEGVVTLDNEERQVKTGDIIHIKQRQIHRIANTSANTKLEFIEVQQGEELNEADIKRYQDDYHR